MAEPVFACWATSENTRTAQSFVNFFDVGNGIMKHFFTGFMPVFVTAFAWLPGKRQGRGHTFGIAHYLLVINWM